MELKEIHTTDKKHFSFMEKVLTDSFPPNEYRDISDIRTLADTSSRFRVNVILEKDSLIGLINYWNFPHFCYIEHFAIDQSIRGKGYGAYSLFLLKNIINSPIILEVEMPLNEIAVRRIKFYRRQDFKLWNNYYEQPPYRETDKSYPMLLMAYGDIQPTIYFKEVRNTLYREVYGVK